MINKKKTHTQNSIILPQAVLHWKNGRSDKVRKQEKRHLFSSYCDSGTWSKSIWYTEYSFSSLFHKL